MSLYTKIIDRQKLSMAWNRVKKNRPACGVDNITWEMYDKGKKENIGQLHRELAEHTYEPLPVKSVTIYKGEKAREIALYTMRDKNVQQAIAVELTRIYDHMFSACTYAYRPNRSALSALEAVENVIKKGAVPQGRYRTFFRYYRYRNAGEDAYRNYIGERCGFSDLKRLYRAAAYGNR